MHALGRDLGPGVHHIDAVDPPSRAADVASELDGVLCDSDPALDAVLAASTAPEAVASSAEELRQLARRWAAVAGVASRTRQRVVDAAGARLTPAAGLAVHPDTVRERAARVDEARAALVAAERDLAAHDASPPPTASAAGPEAVPAAPVAPADRRDGRSAARRNQAVGAVVGAFGVALVLLALDAVPLWAALLVPFAAALWALRHLRPVGSPEAGGSGAGGSDATSASSLLAQMGDYTGERSSPARAQQEHEAARARLDAARSRAAEEVRVAEHAWEDLAGEGIDPADVEEVVRRFDPQLDGASHLAAASVRVRATEAAAATLAGRWATRWEELGLDPPPLEEGEQALDDLLREATRPVVLVGPVVGRAEAVAAQLPMAPVVVVHLPE